MGWPATGEKPTTLAKGGWHRVTRCDTVDHVPELSSAAAGAFQRELEGRLRAVPSTALVRGMFFNMVGDHLTRTGKGGAARAIVGPRRRIYALYPVQELLVAFGQAAPLVVPQDPPEGLREIWSGGSRYFANTWLGKAFQRFIRPDPASALDWLEGAREHFCNYGRWRLELVEPGYAVLHMFDEYIWIESAHRGGCEGLLAACGVEGRVEPVLDAPFSGRLEVRWRLRN
jgi:uncharacterized protein (TIGR02265 family)